MRRSCRSRFCPPQTEVEAGQTDPEGSEQPRNLCKQAGAMEKTNSVHVPRKENYLCNREFVCKRVNVKS